MSDFVKELLKEEFHAVNFDYDGVHYCFAGWWILDREISDKIYDSKEEFIKDKFFNGKTIDEIADEIQNADFEYKDIG